MDKVLIVVPSFGAGGTITSLINLLPIIATEDRKIDVFPLTPSGEYFQDVEKYARLLAPVHKNKTDAGKSFKSSVYLFCGRFVKQIKRALFQIGIDISPVVFKRLASTLGKEHYDYVIAFQEGQVTKFVKYIKGRRKIAWVHSIYSRFSTEKQNRPFENDYREYDRIVCVSETAATDMRNCLPEFSSKVKVVYNALNIENIINKSTEFSVSRGSGLNIVSVGRLDPVKRFSAIPEIAKSLRNQGVVFNWTIIGGVADEKEKNLIQRNIEKFSVADYVKWIGPQYNPYPYIASNDILVCLSSSETFNYTIAEAKVLGVPVITTDFEAAMEFVDNNETGLISPLEGISSAILSLKDNKVLYDHIRSKAKDSSTDWNNRVKEQVEELFSNSKYE